MAARVAKCDYFIGGAHESLGSNRLCMKIIFKWLIKHKKSTICPTGHLKSVCTHHCRASGVPVSVKVPQHQCTLTAATINEGNVVSSQ